MTKHFNKKEMKSRRRELRREMTHCEKIVWTFLRKSQMGARFLRQYSIDNYIVDFYCPKLKIAVEVDGDIHEIAEFKEYDRQRQKDIEEYGIVFVRIENEDVVVNGNASFQRIEECVKTRGAEMNNGAGKVRRTPP